MKKVLSVFLSALLVFACAAPVFAVGGSLIASASDQEAVFFKYANSDSEVPQPFYTVKTYTLSWELYTDGTIYFSAPAGSTQEILKYVTDYNFRSYYVFGDGAYYVDNHYFLPEDNGDYRSVYRYEYISDENGSGHQIDHGDPDAYAAEHGVTYRFVEISSWKDAIADYRNGHPDFRIKDVYVNGDSITHGRCGDNLTWKIEDRTLTVTGSGDMYDFTASDPAPWNFYVNFMEDFLLGDGNDIWITEILLPEGLTSIGAYAFPEFYALLEIDIPSTVTSIGDAAFTLCAGLKTVELPQGLTSIGEYAFAACPLTSVTIPAGCTSVGKGAFATIRYFEAFFSTPSLEEITILSDSLQLPADLLSGYYKVAYKSGSSSSVIKTPEQLRDYATVMRNVLLLLEYADGEECEWRNGRIVAYYGNLSRELDEDLQLAFKAMYPEAQLKTEEDLVNALMQMLLELNRILNTEFNSPEDFIIRDEEAYSDFSQTFKAAFREKFGAEYNEVLTETPDNTAPHMPWVTVKGHAGKPAEAFARQMGANFVCLHEDKNGDGKCDYCGVKTGEPTVPDTPSDPPAQPDTPSGNKCDYCGKVHPDNFIGKLTAFFHTIAYFFAHLFGAK